MTGNPPLTTPTCANATLRVYGGKPFPTSNPTITRWVK